MRSLLLVLLLLLLGACGQQPQSHAIRMGLATAPQNLDPRFATDAASARVNRLLYQRLVEFDEQSMPVPGIADWRLVSPRHYRFTLRRPLPEFSDGTVLSAQDVAATYRYVLDPANASPHRSALSLIEGLEVVAEDSIDFHLARADPLFPAYLVLEILPASLMSQGHSFTQTPVGSGSFRYIGRPEPGRLLLERRRDGQPVELLEVKNPTVRVLKLLRGEIQLLQNDLSPELMGYLREQDEVKTHQVAGSNFSYLGCNLTDESTGNPLVRQALAHAVDRQSIIREVMQQSARSAETLFPPEHWLGHGGLRPIAHSPQRAVALLKEAGYGPDNPLKLVYKTSSDPFRIRLATIIQAQLRAVGIELDLRSHDWGTFFGDIKAGRFQLYSLTWVGLRTPDSFRYLFASDSLPPQGANRGRYANAEVDRLLSQAEQRLELPAMAQDYRQLQEIIHRDLPYIPLWYEDHFSALRKELEGYTLKPDGNYDGLNQLSWRRRYDSQAAD